MFKISKTAEITFQPLPPALANLQMQKMLKIFISAVGGQTNINTCREKELNKQNINL